MLKAWKRPNSCWFSILGPRGLWGLNVWQEIQQLQNQSHSPTGSQWRQASRSVLFPGLSTSGTPPSQGAVALEESSAQIILPGNASQFLPGACPSVDSRPFHIDNLTNPHFKLHEELRRCPCIKKALSGLILCFLCLMLGSLKSVHAAVIWVRQVIWALRLELVGLFGKVMGPLGRETLLGKGCHWGWYLGPTSCSLCVCCVWMKWDQAASWMTFCSGHYAATPSKKTNK